MWNSLSSTLPRDRVMKLCRAAMTSERYFLEAIGIGSGRGEEERDSQSGGHHKHHERNHVLDYFDDNAEKDTSALEEREDVEGLHALE